MSNHRHHDFTDMKIEWRFFREEKIIDFAEIWTPDLIHNICCVDDLDRLTTVADWHRHVVSLLLIII